MRHTARFTGLNVARIALGAMLQNAFACLERQIQAVVGRVALFQRVDDAQALQVVLEPRALGVVTLQASIQRILPGMTKRRMAQVVRQRNRFDQVFIELQRAGDGAPQLRHFQRMRQPGAEQVALVV